MIRMNGHRNKFVIDKRLLFEHSALSMHAFLKHREDLIENKVTLLLGLELMYLA